MPSAVSRKRLSNFPKKPTLLQEPAEWSKYVILCQLRR